ncbi:hypothetical protein SAJA_05945 [Salinisphaera japonica YTM-1]|uniref:Inner membrane protein n=2 Tax=Salinisphaera TaxID=180541 RepID=A0A423PW33_9GAMM|nr:hypothetical protein SAJA_05945 [Salinisphaera japonica YTM-1]
MRHERICQHVSMSSSSTKHRPQAVNNRGLRWLYRAVAGFFIALAAIGVVLPVLPTTPFLIIAAWAAGKASPALRAKLRSHPTYGPPLRRWQDHGAINRRAKILALSLMTASWGLVWLTVDKLWLIGLVGAILVTVGVFIATRPEQTDRPGD